MARGVGVTQLGGGTEGLDRSLEGERQLHGAGGQILFGPANLGHVEVDADDAGRLAGDVGEDSLVGQHVARSPVRAEPLEFVLHRLLRVSQQVAVGGVEALREVGRGDVEDGPPDDLVLGVAEERRVGLVAAYVVQRAIQAKDRHRDRLQELLEEVRSFLRAPFGLSTLGDVTYEGNVCAPISKLNGPNGQLDRQLGAIGAQKVGFVFVRHGQSERAPAGARCPNLRGRKGPATGNGSEHDALLVLPGSASWRLYSHEITLVGAMAVLESHDRARDLTLPGIR